MLAPYSIVFVKKTEINYTLIILVFILFFDIQCI